MLKANFFLLVGANSIAFLCWNVRTYLINWYVLNETNSTFMVGIISAIPSLIAPFFSPYGGKLADQFSKTLIFLLSRIGILITFIILAFSIDLDILPWIGIIVSFVLYGIIAGVEISSSRSLIIDTVGINNITIGNSIMEFSTNTLNTLGPLLVVLFFSNIEDTSSFYSLIVAGLISLIFAFLLFIRFKNPEKNEESDKLKYSVFEGFIYAYSDVNIRILLILTSSVIFWGMSQPLIPKITRDVLGSDGTGYALLLASAGLGGILATILLPIFSRILRNSSGIVISIIIYSISLIAFSVTSSMLLSIIFLAISGFTYTIWFTVIIILLQSLPKKEFKGRVIGLFFTFIQVYGIGFILGGILADNYGVKFTIFLSSILLIFINLLPYMISKEFRDLKS